MCIHVLKQTNGQPGIHVDVEFVNAAAMIEDIELRRPAPQLALVGMEGEE